MAEGSNNLTTYYAKRIIGDNAAASPDKALLQTGTTITSDEWILNQTARYNESPSKKYGILYNYDNDGHGHDVIEFWGNKPDTNNNNNPIPSVSITLDSGNTEIMGTLDVVESTLLQSTLTVNNTSLFKNTVTIQMTSPTLVLDSTASGAVDWTIKNNQGIFTIDNSGSGSGTQILGNSVKGWQIDERLYINATIPDSPNYTLYVSGKTYVSGVSYLNGQVGIGYNPETSGNTHKLYVNGTTYLTDHLYIGRTNSSHIYLINKNWTKGTNPSSQTYSAIEFNSNDSVNNRVALLEATLDTSGNSQFNIFLVPNIANSTSWSGIILKKTNTDVLTVNIAGDTTISGKIFFSGDGIYHIGTAATQRIIGIIDSNDQYGTGIKIGAGGLFVAGSGESTDTIISNLSLTAGGTETTYITSDNAIYFYTNQNSYNANMYMSMNNSQLLISGSTSGGMAHNTTNPKITFVENQSTQPVHIIYTDQDSYRSPAGLKIVGGASASPAWLEVEGSLYLGTPTATGTGIYWNPYVESASDASDVSRIIQVKSGVAGGTELQIYQANDATDVINLVTPAYIYMNSKRAFTVSDSWLRINEDLGFSSGIYTGSSLIRSDNQLQVGSSGSAFYANSSGDGKFNRYLTVNNRIYAKEWIQFDNWTGIYSPNNSAHFYPNNSTSYGAWCMNGSRNGYYGVSLGPSNSYLHVVCDGSGNGGFLHPGVRWPLYYYAGGGRMALMGSDTSSGYSVQVNGSLYVTSTTQIAGTTYLASTVYINWPNSINVRHVNGCNWNASNKDLYLQYQQNAPIYLGNSAAYYISADGSYYSGNTPTNMNGTNRTLQIRYGTQNVAYGTTTTITFSSAFSNACLMVVPLCQQLGFGAYDCISVNNFSKSNFQVYNYNSSHVTMTVGYIAIGY